MLAEHTDDLRAVAHLIYSKTKRGRDALAQRDTALERRHRSVLIMLDGQKSVSALAAVMGPEELSPILADLAAKGYVEQLGAAASAVRPLPAATPAVAPAIDSGRLAYAKSLMNSTARTHLGLLAADVVRRIDAAVDEDQLLRALGHWHMAMQASKHGRDVASTQLALIKASLQGTPA